MQYKLFNETKTVDIPDNLIQKYTDNVRPFNVRVAEYLAVSSECDEHNTTEEILQGIIDGIEDEVYTFQHKEEITAQAIVKYISKEK